MTNELLEKMVGKTCQLSMGRFSGSVHGKVLSIKENWVEVESKTGVEMVNLDFLASIKEVKQG